MKILFCDMESARTSEVKEALPGEELEFESKPAHELSEERPDIEALSVFVSSRVSSAVLDQLPALRVIATRSTGYDHVDMEACKKRGIKIYTVPAYGERTVAEYAFALLLSLSRKIFEGAYRVKHLGSFKSEGLQGFDLYGKTFGVVGTGKIGYHSCLLGLAFGMRVLAYDVKPNEELQKEHGVLYKTLEELLAESDVVSLHAPYLPATHHLLNERNLNLVKPGAVLINTARGALVDSRALVLALKSGRLAGAGLDVLEEEGYIGEEVELLTSHPKLEELAEVLATHELLSMPNVLVTPHNAFNSKEALSRIWQTTYENLLAYKAGSSQNLIQ